MAGVLTVAYRHGLRYCPVSQDAVRQMCLARQDAAMRAQRALRRPIR
jgi:hypothetical protein